LLPGQRRNGRRAAGPQGLEPLLSALLRRGVAVITLNHHLEIEGAAVAGTRLCGALRLHRM
jgi:hypothetical protein